MENYPMRNHGFLILTAALFGITAITGSSSLSFRNPAPSTSSAAALIKRALAERPETALKTLAEAARMAEKRSDHQGILPVASAADRMGQESYERGENAQALRFHQLALALRE